MQAAEMVLMGGLLTAWAFAVFMGLPWLCQRVRHRPAPGIRKPDWVDALLYGAGYFGSMGLVTLVLLTWPLAGHRRPNIEAFAAAQAQSTGRHGTRDLADNVARDVLRIHPSAASSI